MLNVISHDKHRFEFSLPFLTDCISYSVTLVAACLTECGSIVGQTITLYLMKLLIHMTLD